MSSPTIQGLHPPQPDSAVARRAPPSSEARLRETARNFEAMFLAEMLSHAGLGETPEAFGGGFGEDAFADMLVKEQARLMTERGGIGLAERLFEAMAQGNWAE